MSAGQESNETWHEHLVCVMFLLLACQAGAFEIREISCNQMPEPIGVDCHQMRFSWKVESKERDYRQQAYQIEIRESTSGRVVWNSGRRESEESVLVPYGGETLKPATTYIYRVRAWNTAGKSSKWSASRRFTTGLPEKSDWQGARWIALEEDRERVVPENSTAQVMLPTERKEAVRLDGTAVPDGKFVRMEGKKAVLGLGSGTYSIQLDR